MAYLHHDKVIIVLPTYGSPYIWKNKVYSRTDKDKEIMFQRIGEVVQGDVQKCLASNLIIHPMFPNRWRLVSQILKKKGVEVFVNKNGNTTCSPNMAVINKQTGIPFFGDIALTISLRQLNMIIDWSALKLIKIRNHYDAMGITNTDYDDGDDIYNYIFEPNDAEECRKFKNYVGTKGWFIGDAGQVYERATGREDERISHDYDSESDCE